MTTFTELVKDCQKTVAEIMPWDLVELISTTPPPMIIDVREANEFTAMHIENSIHVPRGILETSCEFGYAETIPDLVNARDKPIIVVCRSGNRSLLAAQTMQKLGYTNVQSLMTGLRGWNDYDQALKNKQNEWVNNDDADIFLTSHVSAAQMPPKT